MTNLRLPPLHGDNIEEHFRHIANEQSEPYRLLIEELVKYKAPPMPARWELKPGWTHYCPHTKTATAVPFPDDQALVFDIENCVKEGAAPTIACALGLRGWYSWVSESLVRVESRLDRPYHLSDLIPLESTQSNDTKSPRIIVGHNVSYDRARVREQYLLHGSGTRFLDTMSMHVCVSGVTSYQRAMLKAKREMPEDDLVWSQHSSLNSLVDTHRLYCPDAAPLDKDQRNVFVDGTLQDIRNDFQNLTQYCATDVLATHRVLTVLYPRFCKRFPHPATLAGMLEIGMAYLPVTGGWKRYIQAAHLSYDDLNIEANRILEQRANWACRLDEGKKWQEDIWMWDQDWSKQELRLKKAASKKGDNNQEQSDGAGSRFDQLQSKFKHLHEKRARLPARRPLLPGYPAWYRGLCEKDRGDGRWQPGPVNIGTGMQITPKLLSLCWEGYPLHYVKGKGWGFLVPFNVPGTVDVTEEGQVPLRQLSSKCPVIECRSNGASRNEADDAFQQLVQQVEVGECICSLLLLVIRCLSHR